MSIQTNAISENRKTFFSVAWDYIQNPGGIRNMVLKPINKGCSWIALFQSKVSKSVKDCKKVTGYSSYVLSWVNYPRGLSKSYRSIVDLKESLFTGSLQEISSRMAQVYINVAKTLVLTIAGVEILQKERMIKLSPTGFSVINGIGLIGSSAMVLNALIGARTQLKELATHEFGEAEFKLALSRLIVKVCVIALGVLSMMTFATETFFAPWIFLSISSTILILSLFNYFYRRIHVIPK